MKVTLVVDTERIALTSPEDYTGSNNTVTLTERTRERIREWKAQDKIVDVLIEYSGDYIYRFPVKAGNETWAWYRHAY